MTITKLEWNDLVPDTESYQEVFESSGSAHEAVFSLADTQPRLQYALEQLLYPQATSRFLLAKAPEEAEYLALIASATGEMLPQDRPLVGGNTTSTAHP